MFIVYCHVNLNNGKRYVGVTSKSLIERWQQHVKQSRGKRGQYGFHGAIRKHGESAFGHEVLETCETVTLALEREKWWIATLGSFDPAKGYNQTPGGEGVVRMSPDARARHAIAVKLGHNTPEALENNRAAQKKRFEDHAQRELTAKQTKAAMTPEVCARISAGRSGIEPWNKGIPITEVTRQKLSIALTGKPSKQRKAVEQLTLDGQFVSRFVSIQEASRVTGIAHSGIGLCVRGIYAQSGGFLWRRTGG